MSKLYLVRHGQASVHGDDYDRLSPIGAEQGRALGDFWLDREVRFDRVLIGPRRRHRETSDAVAAAYAERGVDWPQPELLDELDEHHGQQLFESLRPRRSPGSGSGSDAGSGADGGAAADRRRKEKLRGYLKKYQEGTRRWVRGEIETPPHLESWAAFRDRVRTGLAKIVAGDRQQNVAAFSSGGAVAAYVGTVLGLDDEKIMELSWRVRNTGVCELLYSDERGATMHTFNATGHIREPRLSTYI